MKVIGTDLYEDRFDAAVRLIVHEAQQAPKNLCISPSDANVLVHARRDSEFRAILDQYYLNLPDGVPSVWVLKLKGAKQAQRCSGPDLFKAVIEATKELNVNHYLCGGAEGTAAQLAAACKQWGNSKVVGLNSPPFRELAKDDFKSLAAEINALNANIVWVGLGAPKQIYFSHELAKYANVQLIIPIGAAFDFHTGKVKKAPQWIQNIGLEWFFRLCQEPKRLAKRYLTVVPRFILYSMVDYKKK